MNMYISSVHVQSDVQETLSCSLLFSSSETTSTTTVYLYGFGSGKIGRL